MEMGKSKIENSLKRRKGNKRKNQSFKPMSDISELPQAPLYENKGMYILRNTET
jgi:hypothetical protein